MCEHTFVTSQGSPHSRFKRALATGNPTIATAAAAELPRLSLADALGLCLVYREADPERFERAAVRWHGRLCLELRGLSPVGAQLAFAALLGLGDDHVGAAAEALAALLSAHGLSREATVLEDWLDRLRD